MTVLDRRSLNRALLARQLLLCRHEMPALEAIDHLVGLQAQAPDPPYLGLWSRLIDFDFDEVATLLAERRAVRTVLMRGTLHLVSAQDALTVRPLTQVIFDNALRTRDAAPIHDDLVATARTLLEEAPRTDKEMRELLVQHRLGEDGDRLNRIVRYLLPLVQVPPRGIWGSSGQAKHTTLQAWLGRPLDPAPSIDKLVLRYLAAFGPATAQDVQQWSGLTGLREVLERLTAQLCIFTDTTGRTLYDLPDAPRPGPDILAPVRFVPEFDNLLLSHADRSRIISATARKRIFTVNGIVRATILVDGFVAGMWRIDKQRTATTVRIDPFTEIAAADREALTAEGIRLLQAAYPKSDSHTVEFSG